MSPFVPSSNGWELLDGTAITELDGNLISDLTAEELAALAELYDPDKPEQEMNFMLLGETVYSVEVSGLYRFAGQQKQTVCTAPEGAAFEFAAGYAPYDGCIYLLATVDQSDETQETVVMRADTRTGALETLFPVERGENILKADGQYIYVQTRSASKTFMGRVVAYDYGGSAVKAFATPWRWSADGVTVSGEDVEGNHSIITADGQYLLENVAAQSVQIVDGGVYYLLSTSDSTKLYYSGLDADAYEVGTIPLGTNAYLTQRDGQLMVVVPENETTVANYSVPGLEYIDSTRGNQVPSYSLPDPDWEPLSWTITDTATGVEYVVTHMAPHGNCGPLYRLKEDGQVGAGGAGAGSADILFAGLRQRDLLRVRGLQRNPVLYAGAHGFRLHAGGISARRVDGEQQCIKGKETAYAVSFRVAARKRRPIELYAAA